MDGAERGARSGTCSSSVRPSSQPSRFSTHSSVVFFGPRCMPLSEPALIPPIPSFFESRSGSCSFFNDKVATTLRYGSRPFYPYVQCIFILTHFGFSCSLQFYNLLYCRFNHLDMKQIINTYFNTVVFTRNNGVSFNDADKVSVQTYIDAFTARIPPKEVISASRISNGRIAIYLSSREAVIDAVQQGLEYGDSFLELTPLVRPTTRLTLSNVYPEIPNSILVSNISSFCKVVSQIRPIPLGFKNKELTHIMSFRRQVQVLFNPNVTPPDHINFSYLSQEGSIFI